jgi:hypothetical protein
MRSYRGDLRLSNPDWNEAELLGGIRWLRAMLAASCGARPAAAPVVIIATDLLSLVVPRGAMQQ